MIDYKNRTTYTIAAQTKKLPRKRAGKQKFQLSYRVKFYLAIGLILLGCYGYVYYQVRYNPKSVFYDLANTFNKHAPTITNPVRSLTKKETKPITDSSRDKSQIKKWPAKLYLMKVSKKSAKLIPLESSIKGIKENYFKNLISTLIHFKSEDRKIINGFQGRIKILNVYMENDVLILDFNEHFEFSRYGYAGLNLQIQQILWTVFNSKGAKLEKIENIAFMINGVRKKKISGEGLELKLFYSKSDMRQQISLKGNI